MIPKTIFALQAPDNSGKTATFTFLFEKMKRAGYAVLLDKFRKSSKEFFVVLEKEGIKIGLCTYGDNYAIITKTCQRLVDEDCRIIVCACHPAGRTVDAVRSFRAYHPVFIVKTRIEERRLQERSNQEYADDLLVRIEELIGR